MPATFTSRVKLVKSDYPDNADLKVNINPSFDIVDAEIGLPKIPISSGLPGSPYDGQLRRDLNDGYTKIWDSGLGAWLPLLASPSLGIQGVSGGSWKQITPTVTGITLGTGTTKNLFSYIKMPGGVIQWEWSVLLGTGGSSSTSIVLTLPAEFPIDISNILAATQVNDCVGYGSCGLTTASASREGIFALVTSTTAPGQLFFVTGAVPAVTIGSANPFAWAAGSVIKCQGSYRTAA